MGLFDSFQPNQFGNMSFLPGQSQQNYASQMQQLVPQVQQATQNSATSVGAAPTSIPQQAQQPSGISMGFAPAQLAQPAQPAQTPTAASQQSQGFSPQNIMQALSQGSPMALQAFISNPDFRKLVGQS